MTSILRLFFAIFALFFTNSVNGEIEARHGSFAAGARQNFQQNQNGQSTTSRNYVVSPPSYNEKVESHHHVGFGDQGAVESVNNNNNNNNFNNQRRTTTTRRSRYNFNNNNNHNNNGYNNQHRHRNYHDDDDQFVWGSQNVNNRNQQDSEEKN